MKKTFVLVNSLLSYNFAKKKIIKKNIVWMTTSPYLHNYFKSNKINFLNIEKEVDLKLYKKISVSLVTICRKTVKEIDNLKSKNNYIDYSYLLSAEYLHLLSSLFYKVYLLDCLKKKFKDKIIVVGSIDEPLNFELNYMNYRFSNIFLSISNLIFKDIDTLQFKVDRNIKLKKINEVKNRRMFFFEKFLSITNNGLSSFFFKISKKFLNSVHLPFFKKKGEVVIYDATDQIEDAFLKLLKEGWKLKFSNKLFFEFSNAKQKEIMQFKKNNYHNFLKIFKSHFPKNSSNVSNIYYKKCYEICLNSLIKEFLKIEKSKKKLDLYFDDERKKNNNKFIFLSNYIFDLVPNLYVQYLKNKSNKIIYSEHGFCMGTLQSMQYRNFFHPMNIADFGIYYWDRSIKMTKNFIKHQKSIIGGFPKSIYNDKIINFKKYIIKKLIGIKNSKKSLIYVADIEKNNFQYGPCDEIDYEYMITTRNIISYLCKKYKNFNIVLKLYPTNRYLDNYEFNDLKLKYNNLITVRFIDFRFLRYFFDKVYISSGLSALGWALGNKSQVIYLEKKNDTLLSKECIKKKLNIKIKGVKNIFLLNKEFPKSNTDWVKKI